MKSIKASFPYMLASFLLSCFLLTDAAQAQNTNQPEEDPTLQSLLHEVRLLRKTLQRTGLNAYRSQIILERIRADNEQVVRLTRMLEDVRNEMERVEATIPRFIEQNKLMQNRIEQETDWNKRAQLEFEIKDRKQAVERYKLSLERQRERERQLSTQLLEEQANLSALQSRLDALEREIEGEVERQRAEESTQEKKKQL